MARVANLYLPLVGILIDNLPKLFAWPSEGEVRIVWPDSKNENLNLILTAISDNVPNVSQLFYRSIKTTMIEIIL